MEKDNKNNTMLTSKQKLVRAGGIILFVGALGLCLARIANFFITKAFSGAFIDEVTTEIVTNVIFTFAVQVLCLFVAPFLVYKLYLKGKTSNFLAVSNVRLVSVKVCLLAVLVGLLAPVLSMTVNLIVNTVFINIGICLPSSVTILPKQFNFLVLLLNILLTAILPGICEEIFNRGIVLSALRSMFSEWAVILLGGLVFALFHQYIFQTFYTGAFGMIIVFVTLKTKSALPAMIIHFTNNFVAVIGEFSSFYNWGFESIQSVIANANNVFLMIGLILVGLGLFALSIYLLVKTHKSDVDKKLITRLVKEGKIPKEIASSKKVNYAGVMVIGGPLGDVVYYKPTLKDTIFYWGALAVSLFTTAVTLLVYML